MKHSDCAWRHVESVGVNWLDDPGIRDIIINCRDVTETIIEEALREGEARYRQLTELATDIIYNCDLEGLYRRQPDGHAADEIRREGPARPPLSSR